MSSSWTISCDSQIAGVEDPEEYVKASVARGDYKPIVTWLKGMERWAQRASEVVEDQVLVNDEQIGEAYSRVQPRVVTSLDLDKPNYLSMSIYTGSTTTSDQLFAFADVDKAILATKSDNRCSLCRIDVNKEGGQEDTAGHAAHLIAASLKAHEVLAVAKAHNVVPQNGSSDPGEALGVNDAKLNGIWLCPTCHGMLGKENLLVCPPLQILRAVRETYNPKKATLQEFLEHIYAKEFPRLRSLYHLVRISPNPVPMSMPSGKVVHICNERFLLHNGTDGQTQRIKFDQTDSTDLTEPHIWCFPCLKPENVFAVLLYMTGRPPPTTNRQSLLMQPPSEVPTLNDQFLSDIHWIKININTRLSATRNDGSNMTGATDGTGKMANSGTREAAQTDGFSSMGPRCKHILGDVISVPGDEHVLGDINVAGDERDTNVAGDVHVLGGKGHNGP